jgi:hypothetical protein
LLLSKSKMNFQAYALSSHPEWACLQVKAPDSEARTPVHLCCVIDTSASMECDRKLENVKQSLQFLLDFLGPQDSVSVITFSEAAKTILTQTAVTATEKDNIRARISIIRVESNTNLSAGIIQARDSLQIDTSNTKQGILLLTDGIANMGLTRPQDILELVRNTIDKFRGTSISSVGYGTDHNVELLQNISTEGGGSYYVVNNLEDVATVFGDILGGLVSCAAQQVRVVLPVGTEVKSRYATNIIGDQMEIVIGDVPAGAEAAFLAKIPAGRPVTLKGYDLVAHNTFEMNTTVSTTEDAGLQVNGEAHYLRFEVMALLEQSRSLMNFNTPAADVTAQIAKIDACIATITTHRAAHEHSLWDILLDELNACKRTLQHRNVYDIATPHLMTQHAGYLGRMRGLPAALSQVPSALPSNPMAGVFSGSEGCGDPDDIPAAIPVTRTFSNYAQRQISSQLTATVSGGSGLTRQQAAPSGLHNGTQDPGCNSGATSPVLRWSPALRPMNNALPIPPIPELGTLTESLPFPSGPLTRQVACGVTLSRSSSDGTD